MLYLKQSNTIPGDFMDNFDVVIEGVQIVASLKKQVSDRTFRFIETERGVI